MNESMQLVQALHAAIEDEVLAEQELAEFGPIPRCLETLRSRLARLEASDDYAAWHRWWGAYAALTRQKLGWRNMRADFAEPYSDRQDFQQSAELQRRALCLATFWDTYEHGGRRQLERLLAEGYHCEDALLVNSGMAALVCVLEGLGLQAGDAIVIDPHAYFETRHFLESYLRPRGIEVVERNLGPSGGLREFLAEAIPRCVLCEAAALGPGVSALGIDHELIVAQPEVMFVIDNSVGSHAVKWFSPQKPTPQNLLVFESGSKSLSETLMSGVIYGGQEVVESARGYAQASGMQLQALAFNAFNVGDLLHVEARVRLHGQNVRTFLSALETDDPLTATVDHNRWPSAFSEQGPLGPLLYLRFARGGRDDAARLDALLANWQTACRRLGIWIPFRCGYGWHQTTARIYAGTALNRRDAPTYLRISVGLESHEVITALASELLRAMRFT